MTLAHICEIGEVEVRAVWGDPSLTRKQAAKRLGIGLSALRRRAGKLELAVRDQQSGVSADRIAEMWQRGDLSRREQAAALGLSVDSLRERARKLGLPMRRGGTVRKISAKRIRDVWLDTRLTSSEAAAAVGLSRSNLWLRAKALNLPPRKCGNRCAVDNDELLLLAAMWRSNVSGAAIAENLGIGLETVYTYARKMELPNRRGLSRKHLISASQFKSDLVERIIANRMATDAKDASSRMNSVG